MFQLAIAGLTAVAAVMIATALVPTFASTAAGGSASPGVAVSAPASGQTLSGLRRGEPGRPCAGQFQVVGVRLAGRPACTHGPDGGSTYLAAAAGSKPGGKKSPSPSPSPSPTGAPSGARCGTDGPRVQALYVHAADVTDRYTAVVPSLQQFANTVDSVFAASAAETGGVRHVRFVTDASCVPVVPDVTVTSTGDDDLSDTINELQAQGYNRTDRKYLLWVDANVYCGIGTVQSDDSATSTNLNNSGPSYGRTDAGCWGGDTEAHELEHNLGGVQLTAPHTDGGWHCTDEYDLMCYETSGHTMTYPCPLEHDHVLDCGHDDYFSTAPDAGSYLSTHWNSANSVFLTSAG